MSREDGLKVATQPLAVDVTGGRPHRSTMRPLIGYELVRAMRHPAFVATLAVVVLAWVLPWAYDRSVFDLTVVNVDAVTIQVWLLLPVVGAFIGASLIGLADHRFGAAELLAVVGVPDRTRLLARVVASVGPAGLVLMVSVLRLGAVSLAPGAAGRPPLVGDVLTPAALTVLAAVLASCCANLFRSLAVCAAALAVLGVFTIVGAFAAYGTSARGLMPIMVANVIGEPPVPTALLTRPAGWHAAYVVALAATVLAITVIVKHTGSRRWIAVAVASALLAVGAGVAQVRSGQGTDSDAAWSAVYEEPADSWLCTDVGSDSYCAFRDYASRVTYWRDVVTAQKRLLPPEAATTPVRVRQRLSPPQAWRGGTPPSLPWQAWQEGDAARGDGVTVPVSTRWARPGEDDFAQNDVLGFSVLTAASLVGWEIPTNRVPRHGEVCGGQGVLTAWLATQSSPPVSSAYQVVKSHSSGLDLLETSILGSGDTVVIGEHEVMLSNALANVPREQVLKAVTQHWGELSAESTGVDRAATLLGVTPVSAKRVTTVCGGG